jgi:NTP pyrophosphatase (non-canonical NTP hydrolase)
MYTLLTTLLREFKRALEIYTMDILQYQNFVAERFTSYEGNETLRTFYAALALNGEAGEAAEEVKKMFKPSDKLGYEERVRRLKLELGDTLYYLTALGQQFDISLEEIIEGNVEKLEKRSKKGKDHASE